MYYEKFSKMIAAVRNMDNSEDVEFYLDTIQQKIDRFESYVEKVFKMVIQYPILDARFEGQALQDKKMALDESRTVAHNAAIAACSVLNRICISLDVEPFCPNPDEHSRTEIADFVGQFVYEVYLAGTGHSDLSINSMDDIVKEAESGHIKLEQRKVI